MNLIKLFLYIFLSSYTVTCLAENKNVSIKSPVWEKVKNGITFSLKQIPVAQVSAFYIGRGFSSQQIKPYANSCVYRAIMRNDKAADKIHFIRNNWLIKTQESTQNITKNMHWLELFKQKGVKPSALIAFRLAQLPEEQEYQPNGDWNQGMLSVNLAVGSKFDIIIRWDMKGKPYEFTLQGISCTK